MSNETWEVGEDGETYYTGDPSVFDPLVSYGRTRANGKGGVGVERNRPSLESSVSSSTVQQFRDYLGRNPTSSELARAAEASPAQIKAYLASLNKGKSSRSSGSSGSSQSSGSSGSSQSSGSSGSGSSSSGALEQADADYTKLSRYQELTKLKDPSILGMDRVSQEAIGKLDEQFASTLGDMGGSIKNMSDANAPLLQGKIPASLSAQVRQIAAESASGAGIFGPGARAFTARDLGRTALDVLQQGLDNEVKVNAVRESQAKMAEASSQFKRTYNVQVNEMLNVLRNTDLDEARLDQSMRQFNATMQFNIMTAMLDMAKARAQYTTTLAINDVDSSGVASDFNGIIDGLGGLLEGGNYKV